MSADVDSVAVAATISNWVLASTCVAPVVAIEIEPAAMSIVFVLTVALVELRKILSAVAAMLSWKATVAFPAVRTMSPPTEAEALVEATA